MWCTMYNIYRYENDHSIETTNIDLSIVIPAYNEESRLPKTLDLMLDFLDDWCEYKNWNYEVNHSYLT